VPVYNILLTHLEAKCENVHVPSASVSVEGDYMEDAAQAAFAKLNKYYDISSELCTIATVLDLG
jgi:hypothetical protein